MNLPDPWLLDALDRANRKVSAPTTTFKVKNGDEIICTTCGRTHAWHPKGCTVGLGCLLYLGGLSLVVIGIATLGGGVGILPLFLGFMLLWAGKGVAEQPTVTCPHCGATSGFHPADSPAGKAFMAALEQERPSSGSGGS